MSSMLCKIGFHRWTEDNKLSKLMMQMEFGKPFGCTGCGIQKDEAGNYYPCPTKPSNINKPFNES